MDGEASGRKWSTSDVGFPKTHNGCCHKTVIERCLDCPHRNRETVENGPKLDIPALSRADYEAQVRGGLHDIRYLLHLVEVSVSILPAEDWQRCMNAQVAKVYSALSKLK